MSKPEETFVERVTRLCVEKNIPKARIFSATGVSLKQLGHNRSISLQAASGLAKLFEMSLFDLDAPILFRTTTRELVDAGIIRE